MKIIYLAYHLNLQNSSYLGELDLQKGRWTIGRENTDVIIEDPRCSRVHAEMWVNAKGEISYLDSDSSNGSYLGNRKIRQGKLSVGDKVRIGNTIFMLTKITAPSPRATRSEETGQHGS